eukprot:2076_1
MASSRVVAKPRMVSSIPVATSQTSQSRVPVQVRTPEKRDSGNLSPNIEDSLAQSSDGSRSPVSEPLASTLSQYSPPLSATTDPPHVVTATSMPTPLFESVSNSATQNVSATMSSKTSKQMPSKKSVSQTSLSPALITQSQPHHGPQFTKRMTARKSCDARNGSQISEPVSSPNVKQSSAKQPKSARKQLIPKSSQSKLLASKSVCSKPQALKPQISKPSESEPPVSNSLVPKLPVSKPLSSKPLVLKSPVSKPLSSKPLVFKSPVSKPLASKPLVFKSPVSKPLASKPLVFKSPVSKPLASKPLLFNSPVRKPPASKPLVCKLPANKLPVTKPPVISKPPVSKSVPKPSASKPVPKLSVSEPSFSEQPVHSQHVSSKIPRFKKKAAVLSDSSKHPQRRLVGPTHKGPNIVVVKQSQPDRRQPKKVYLAAAVPKRHKHPVGASRPKHPVDASRPTHHVNDSRPKHPVNDSRPKHLVNANSNKPPANNDSRPKPPVNASRPKHTVNASSHKPPANTTQQKPKVKVTQLKPRVSLTQQRQQMNGSQPKLPVSGQPKLRVSTSQRQSVNVSQHKPPIHPVDVTNRKPSVNVNHSRFSVNVSHIDHRRTSNVGHTNNPIHNQSDIIHSRYELVSTQQRHVPLKTGNTRQPNRSPPHPTDQIRQSRFQNSHHPPSHEHYHPSRRRSHPDESKSHKSDRRNRFGSPQNSEHKHSPDKGHHLPAKRIRSLAPPEVSNVHKFQSSKKQRLNHAVPSRPLNSRSNSPNRDFRPYFSASTQSNRVSNPKIAPNVHAENNSLDPRLNRRHSESPETPKQTSKPAASASITPPSPVSSSSPDTQPVMGGVGEPFSRPVKPPSMSPPSPVSSSSETPQTPVGRVGKQFFRPMFKPAKPPSMSQPSPVSSSSETPQTPMGGVGDKFSRPVKLPSMTPPSPVSSSSTFAFPSCSPSLPSFNSSQSPSPIIHSPSMYEPPDAKMAHMSGDSQDADVTINSNRTSPPSAVSSAGLSGVANLPSSGLSGVANLPSPVWSRKRRDRQFSSSDSSNGSSAEYSPSFVKLSDGSTGIKRRRIDRVKTDYNFTPVWPMARIPEMSVSESESSPSNEAVKEISDSTRDIKREEVKNRISHFVRKKLHSDQTAQTLKKRQLTAIIQKVTQKFSRCFDKYTDKHPTISVTDFMNKSQYKKIENMYRKMLARKT